MFRSRDNSGGKSSALNALADITTLKKLCNHLNLIYDKIVARENGFEEAPKILQPHYNLKWVEKVKFLRV